jgi:hypothetical protein
VKATESHPVQPKHPNGRDAMFNVKDLTKRYSVNEDTVRGWINSGQLKAINVGRTPNSKRPRWRITQAALDAFEAARAAIPPQPSARPRRAHAAGVVEFF